MILLVAQAMPEDPLWFRVLNLPILNSLIGAAISGQSKSRRALRVAERVFEKFYLGASRLSMRRMAARSMKASEVWTFNS